MGDKANNKEIGNLGEDLACKFLMKRGFEIIERNYWKKFGEIDVVAKKGDIIHFVEVKSVSCVTFSETNIDNHRPEDNIHPVKLARLSRTIQTYLIEKGVSLITRSDGQADEIDWKFDVVTVYLNLKDKTAKVEILEDLVIS